MALTKVSGDFIQNGSITQGHLHASHGITTSDIGEGSNLYFTTARVDSRIGDLSTSDLSEGTNLYYTDARADARIAAASTSDLSEGTNLYYTDTRVGSYLTTNNYLTASSTHTLTNKSGNISQWTNDSGYITDGNTNWNNSYGFVTASSTETLTNKSGNISMFTNDSGYITDGNTNWDNSYGFITASSTDTLTNKSGNISQWTNDSGYITDGNTNWNNIYGFITDGNTNWNNIYGFITASSTDTLTNKSGNISQWTNDSGYLTTTISSDVTFTTNTKLNLGTGVLWQGYHDGSSAYLNNISGNYYIRNTASNADLFIGVNQGGTVHDVITIDGSSLLTTIAGSTTLIKSSSGNADLYLGNVISASSSIRGARFHSNNADFYFDFQGDSTQNWFLRDYDGSGGIYTRFGFDFINSTFTASGDIVAYGSPSDITLKENIKPIENALDKVEKLQGVTFNWKEPGLANLNKDIGFIAQDVQKVLPELVRENENGKLSLRHQGIVPILLEAIKELSDKVKALENGSTK